MAVDIIARGLGASAGAAADLANSRLDSLSSSLVYRGAVDYYSDLSGITSPEPGDAYTVKYKGTSGTTPEGTEYAWGEYEGTPQWIAIGPDMSQYQPVLVSGTNIKTINNQSILGSGNMDIATNQAFPTSWPTTSATTTKAFCDAVNADSSAVAGMSYLGEVRWSDLPSTLVNAEVVVEIMHGTGTSGKVIHLVLTSGNLAPYRWEYTYWNNGSNTSGWIGYQPQLTAGDGININSNNIITATHDVFDVTLGTTTKAAILDAIAAGRLPVMKYDEHVYVAVKYSSSAITFLDSLSGNGYIVTGTKTYTYFSGATYVYRSQGSENEGKTLRVDNEGILSLVDWPSSEIIYDTTYADLVAAQSGGSLSAGAFYRITDYVTKINGTYDISSMAGSAAYVHYAKSAEHPFDIIVQALDENTLSENASAIQHDGDTYFTNSDLSAWQLKYTIENDPTQYAWADATNGKGVIYYMKDEFGNECRYDFKNIQYLAYAITYTESQYEDSLCYDASNQPKRYGSVYYVFTALENYMETGSYIPPFPPTWRKDFSAGANILDAIQFPTVDATYLQAFNADWYYTFDEYDESTGTHLDKTLNSSGLVVTYDNVIGRTADALSVQLSLPNIPEGLPANIFEYLLGEDEYEQCWSNVLGGNSLFNVFGVAFATHTLTQFAFNVLGDNCYSNTFGDDCQSNSFGDSCYSNTFGDSCGNNSFGDNCYSNTFGDNCLNNSFGDSCGNNSFGNSYYGNSFGNECGNNSFGNNCSDNTFDRQCGYNTVREGTSYIEIINGTQSASVGRYTILSGQYGTSVSNRYQLTISTSLASQNYAMYVGLDASGSVRIWNPAEVDMGIPYITTAPTSDNTSGKLIFVVLASEPQTRYAGYYYIILGA